MAVCVAFLISAIMFFIALGFFMASPIDFLKNVFDRWKVNAEPAMAIISSNSGGMEAEPLYFWCNLSKIWS